MPELEFESQDSSPLISEGEHVVQISSVYLTEANGSDMYNDKSAQLAVVFLADNGKQITRWFNLMGFQKDESEPTVKDSKNRTVPNYITDEDGNRIEDPDATEACKRIIGQLGYDAGVKRGGKFKAGKLEGCKLGIAVVRDESSFGSKLKVAYTLPLERVSEGTADAIPA